MESLLAEFKKQSANLGRHDQQLQLEIDKLEAANNQLSHENENLLQRVETFEKLKHKQGTIVSRLSKFHHTVTSSVVSPTSTPIKMVPTQEDVSESSLVGVAATVTTNEDAKWETVSTDEYIPFESSTKRPQKYDFKHLVHVSSIDTASEKDSNSSKEVEIKPSAADKAVEWPVQQSRLNGDSDIVQRARVNAARRDQLRNKCWFFQAGRCAYGDICLKSHDVLPFKYCATYNTEGKCSVDGCKGMHELFEYKKPALSFAERQALLRAVHMDKRK